MQQPLLDAAKAALNLLADKFQDVLYEDDPCFMDGMKTRNLAGDDLCRYRFWEWPQGVGLFGYWMLFCDTGRSEYLDVLTRYYDRQLECGFPARNVNTTAPMLALSCLAEYSGDSRYLTACDEWAEWIMQSCPRTREGGLQHVTSDSFNEQELWDDTLFMMVLFLANMGRIRHNAAYTAEAEYQFMLHAKYLTDRKTGLWYHGWTFAGDHNFAGALWGRGNCWITASIPAYLQMGDGSPAVARYLTEALRRQAESLLALQDESGMWHTLLNDPASYQESSATCGIAYGLLRAVRMGLIDRKYTDCARRAIRPILDNIDQHGAVAQVSYGTPMGRESLDFYRNIPLKVMPYGQALAILYLIEYIHSFDDRDNAPCLDNSLRRK